jgi:ribosome-associated protein
VTASDRSLELTTLAAIAAAEKKAEQIVAIDVSDQLAITDVFLLCSASNDRQVKAIVDAIEAALDAVDVDPVRREGEREGRWILLDYLDFVVHVQHTEERSFYGLERLWKDCPIIELPEVGRDGAPSGGVGDLGTGDR